MFPVGTRLHGRFRVTGHLGSGGMGEVLSAEDSKLGREVALKVLTADGARDPELLARFEREARAAQKIGHPGIVRVYEVSKGEGGLLPYLVMERLRGVTLDEVVDRGRLPIDRALTISIEMLDALAAAHAAGIVHRDVKPQNVHVAEDLAPGSVKLLDFGVAKLADDARLTASGAVLGTPLYMPPEQLRGEVVDPAADVYAAGAVLYELLTGAPIFDAPPSHLWVHVLKTEPVPVAELRPDVPPAVAEVVGRALRKARAERYADAAEMKAALEAAAKGVAVTRPARRSSRAPRRRRRSWWVVAAIVAGLLVAAIAAGAAIAVATGRRSHAVTPKTLGTEARPGL